MFFCKAVKKIISVRGMLHPGALGQKALKKKMLLTALKAFDVVKKCFFHATDETEKYYIKKEFGANSNIFIAGNFAKSITAQVPLAKDAGTLIMGTVALISPMKNHLLVLEALKECRESVTYNIYGPVKDAAYWQTCEAVIAALPKNIQVNYYGEVAPAMVPEILAQQHVYIMPSKSENFGHAIAEAFAAARPVITSHTTPWNNLERYKAGINVDLTIDSILKAIAFFAQLNQVEYESFVKGAKQYSAAKSNILQTVAEYSNMFFETNKK